MTFEKFISSYINKNAKENAQQQKIEKLTEKPNTKKTYISAENPLLLHEIRSPIVLKGTLLFIHMPSESRLKAQVGPLNPTQLTKIWAQTENWRKPVDERYKEKSTRGRESEARGHRVDQGENIERERIFNFPAFPGSFLNVLSTIRRDLCDERIRNCLVLEEEQIGNKKQNLYVLPHSNLPEMITFITDLNKTIDRLNADIYKFTKSNDFLQLANILIEYNAEKVIVDRNWHIPHISWRVTPIALEPETVMNIVESEKGKMESEVLETYRQDLERQQTELVTKALHSVEERVNFIVGRIVASRNTDPQKVKVDLERLRGLATSIGLEHMSTQVINPLIEYINDIDNPDKLKELFAISTKANLPNVISGRVKGLIERL